MFRKANHSMFSFSGRSGTGSAGLWIPGPNFAHRRIIGSECFYFHLNLWYFRELGTYALFPGSQIRIDSIVSEISGKEVTGFCRGMLNHGERPNIFIPMCRI